VVRKEHLNQMGLVLNSKNLSHLIKTKALDKFDHNNLNLDV